MPYKFFTIPIHDDGKAADELNRFLAGYRIVGEEIELIHDGGNSRWVACVHYLAPDERATAKAEKRSKVDYREVLSDANFQLFVRLRELRKELSERDAVPVYSIFSNQQLATIVESKITTVAALSKIAGIGESKIKNYGQPVLTLMQSLLRDGSNAAEESP